MEIRVLRYSLTVVREESITKAVEMLHTTQPILSRQLTQLGEEIGVKLFIRGARKIFLTNEGIPPQRRAEETTMLVGKTEKELSIQEEQVEGCISIGCGELVALETLSELLKSFIRRYSRVTFDLFTANADQVKERMEVGTIDIGLLLEPIDIDKHEFIRPGTRERWVALMRPDDPLAGRERIMAKDLAGLPIIMARRIRLQNELANWFGDYFKGLNILFKSNFSTDGAIMVRNGPGHSLMVEGSALPRDKDKIYYRSLYSEITSTCVLVWKQQQPLSRAAMKLIEYVKDSIATVETQKSKSWPWALMGKYMLLRHKIPIKHRYSL